MYAVREHLEGLLDGTTATVELFGENFPGHGSNTRHCWPELGFCCKHVVGEILHGDIMGII